MMAGSAILFEIYYLRMLHEHKIIVHVDGVYANVFKIKPPLVVTKDDCTHILQALDSVLASIKK